MNLFECHLKSSGGGSGVTLTVTCDPAFAGKTITCAKSGTTLTATCPSASPYTVTFTIPESGTWTISATVDGTTYTTTVTADLELEATLDYGLNWQAWATAGGIDPTGYNDLDELLADEEAVRRLMLVHAAVDYLCNATADTNMQTVINNDLCAKWINLCAYALDSLYAVMAIKALMDAADKYGYGEWCLMPQVPTMTSNTAPYGVASANQEYTPAYYAFNGDSSNGWGTTNTTTNSWLKYDFGKLVKPVAVDVNTYASVAVKYKIQGSVDDSTWKDLTEEITGLVTNRAVVHSDFTLNLGEYRYVRFICTGGGSGNLGGINMQIYAWQPKGNVPIMTSNTAPYGEAIASSNWSGSGASNYANWKAFDPSNTYGWASERGTSAWLGYKFTNPIAVRKAVYYPFLAGSDRNVKLQYSDDNSIWTDASNEVALSEDKYYTLQSNVDSYHLYWRIYLTSTVVQTFNSPSLQFYGRELSVSVPTMTSNTAPYGEASASSNYASEAQRPSNAFGRDTNSGWATASGTTLGWLRYDFNNPIVVKMFMLKNQNGQYSVGSPKNYTIEGSNDGTNWTTLYTGLNSKTAASAYSILEVDNDIPYSKYRINASDMNNPSQGFMVIGQLQFYGLDYSEKEFEAGATKKWLYDHGVELETLTPRAGASGTLPINDGESYVCKGGSASSDSFSYVDANSIDLSDYSVIRCKIGDAFNSLTYIYVYAGSISGSIVASTQLESNNLPNNNSLDISSVNQSCAVEIGVGSGGNGTTKCVEWWLE